MSDEHKSSLISFHAFTGNDYVSSIFRGFKEEQQICQSLFISW